MSHSHARHKSTLHQPAHHLGHQCLGDSQNTRELLGRNPCQSASTSSARFSVGLRSAGSRWSGTFRPHCGREMTRGMSKPASGVSTP